MTREEWLAQRKQGIGGSDAAAILGLNPWASAFDVYLDKLGLKEEKEDTEAMRQGRDLEEYVAHRFIEATGKELKKEPRILQHPEHEWMLANVDRLIVGENAGLECKTTSTLNVKPFKRGEYPPQYYVQCAHYMAVTGAAKWYLAVLVLGREFHIFEIERDEAEIAALIEAEKEFWFEHVQKKIPPQPDGKPATTAAIKQMFPGRDDLEAVVLQPQEEDKISRYLALQEQIKGLEQEAEKLKQELCLALGDAQIGITRDYVVEWKIRQRQSLDTKRLRKEQPDIYMKYLRPATTYRVFNIKGGKQK
jgi:putative phage-type endonuclease